MRRGSLLTVALVAAAAGIGGCSGSLAKPEGGADAPVCDVVTQSVRPVEPLARTPCRYPIPTPPPECVADLDRAHIGVKIANNEIPRDPNHANGWDFTDATMETVDVYGPSCDALTASPAPPVSIVFKLLIP